MLFTLSCSSVEVKVSEGERAFLGFMVIPILDDVQELCIFLKYPKEGIVYESTFLRRVASEVLFISLQYLRHQDRLVLLSSLLYSTYLTL